MSDDPKPVAYACEADVELLSKNPKGLDLSLSPGPMPEYGMIMPLYSEEALRALRDENEKLRTEAYCDTDKGPVLRREVMQVMTDDHENLKQEKKKVQYDLYKAKDLLKEARKLIVRAQQNTPEHYSGWHEDASVFVKLYKEGNSSINWRPILTAPVDGTSILLRLSNGEVFSGWGTLRREGAVEFRRFHATSSDVGWLNPKHWMPMPADPPKEDAT